jgi:hypothetical protein
MQEALPVKNSPLDEVNKPIIYRTLYGECFLNRLELCLPSE